MKQGDLPACENSRNTPRIPKEKLKSWGSHSTILLGGFNPSEKYESQWEGLSHIL